MGVRLQIIDNPANRARPDVGEIGSPTVSAPSFQTARQQPLDEYPQTQRVTLPNEPASGETSAAPPRMEAKGINSEPSQYQAFPSPALQVEPADIATENVVDWTPHLRNFRFLIASESIRGRELEARQRQLERRLESTGARLNLADSLLAQIDIRLERAHLEQDIEAISSEIRQLRLHNIFEPPAVTDSPKAAARQEKQASENQATRGESLSKNNGINVLA